MLMLLSLPTASLRAGETTASRTGLRQPCPASALKHVPFKAVILEFVDPQETNIGESLSRLFWREVLFSISDLKGTGVILGVDCEQQVRAKTGQSSTQLIGESLHDAAQAVAKLLNVQIGVWGAVVGDKHRVTMYSFLTIRPEAWKSRLGMSFSGLEFLSIPLARTDFNFDPIIIRRDQFFGGTFRVRCALSVGCPGGVPTYQEPLDDSARDQALHEGDMVTLRDMTGKWMLVERTDGRRTYMNIYHADIGPRAVFIREPAVRMSSSPGSSNWVGMVSPGTYDVLEMTRVGSGRHPWYRISNAEKKMGWVGGDKAEPLYRFPATHFLAGLYRYATRQFSQAQRELERFLDVIGPRADVVLRSSTLQLIAASRAQKNEEQEAIAALQLLDVAAKLTPFDPAIPSMRALVQLHYTRELDQALPDLKRAVRLDTENSNTSRLITELTSRNLATLGIYATESIRDALKALR
jgi:hypothetical protein